MKYCPECGSEYQEGVATCADDGATLLTAEELRARGLPVGETEDARTFVPVGDAEDPLTADALTRVLETAGLQVLVRARQNGFVDRLTDGVTGGWWELRVPEADRARAEALLQKARAELAASQDEAARAAEEEAEESIRAAPPPTP